MVLPVDLRHRVVDGFIPSDLGTGTPAEIEEEHRLLYVAMTSAKDDLHLIVASINTTTGSRSGRWLAPSASSAAATFARLRRISI